MDVLKKINNMRLEKGWSVYRLSLESGISQSTLTNMFNRETLPSITTLECICHAFGITMAEFFKEAASEQKISDTQLLSLYNALGEEAQRLVVSLMKELSNK